MADLFSTAAAAISLVDVALKSAREIQNIIASIKGAQSSLFKALETICEVQGLLEGIQSLEADYQKASTPHVNPQILSRIRRNVKSINEDLMTLRVKIEEPIFATDSRFRRLSKALRFHNNERSIAKVCSQIEQKMRWINHDLTVIGRQSDLFQIGQLRTANDNTQLVVRGQTQFRDDTLGMLRSNAAVSQQLLNQQQHTHINMLDGHAQIRADIRYLQPGWLQNIPQILLHEGSASDATEILSITVMRM
ncbi:hypothetical protein SLS55_000064 [Diplodia seriata]|uniref:Fungal N-terminal domain-containing protein n=1 Tax=Diplodia seriata TaxID=420778 RepID=A0ABR3CT83_9PEZI